MRRQPAWGHFINGSSRQMLQRSTAGLAAWYSIAKWARLKGHLRGLNDAASHVGGGPLFEWADLELGAEASADAQLVALGEINERDDPYFAVLGNPPPTSHPGAESCNPCHRETVTIDDVIWGTPYRWWNGIECGVCHQY